MGSGVCCLLVLLSAFVCVNVFCRCVVCACALKVCVCVSVCACVL